MSWYPNEKRWSSLDDWVEVEDSSRKLVKQLCITELPDKVSSPDIVIASRLSWLRRYLKEVIQMLQTLIHQKRCRLIFLKRGQNLNPANTEDMARTILLTIVSVMAKLERGFISECTRESLKAGLALGSKLGKTKGAIQQSIYDKDKEHIFHWYALGGSYWHHYP